MRKLFLFGHIMIGVFLDGSQVLTTCRCGLSSMASSNYFQYQSMTIWANQPIHSFLVGCLNPCLQGTSVWVGSPQPSMTYNKLCVNKVSCFMEVYLCEQNELLYGGLYVWTKWVAFWNLNLSLKSWVLASGVLELMRHDGFADLVRYTRVTWCCLLPL